MGDGGEHWLVWMEWCPAGWSVSASVNPPLHHKDRKFSYGTGSPGSSWKKGRKTVVVVLLLSRITELARCSLLLQME